MISLLKTIKFLLFRVRNRSLAKICVNSYVYNTLFEGYNSVAKGSVITNCKFGIGTYVNRNSTLNYVKIGRYCSIADNVSVCLGNHPLDFLTTHPAFYYDTRSQIGWSFHDDKPLYKGIYKYPSNEDYYQILIGNDVWIGSHVILMGGIKIGDGAVVAAGSVVTKDVKPYSVVGGVPAKIIKMRFNEKTVNKILDCQWWNWPIEEIKNSYKHFLDINEFLNKTI